MKQRLDIRAAAAADLPVAVEMLRAAGLPTQDLLSRNLALVAEDETGVQGVIGLETFGDVALLRSLVVSLHARGQGVGCLLVKSLELLARERGIDELWLLTTDADAYFSCLGFVSRQRERAPAVIRDSQEFAALCPDDAVLMSKSL